MINLTLDSREFAVNKKWIYKKIGEPSEELINFTKSNILAELLVSRGIQTVSDAEEFLYPERGREISPYAFCDMPKAVDRILKSIEKKEKIIIFGDFDCDGVTSTSLMVKTLCNLGADVDFYVPDRKKEGHGLNNAAICRLISAAKAKLIITVDCGVSNLKEINIAKTFGCDVIITDHHEAPDELPAAYAIINPKAPNSLEPSLEAHEIVSLNYLAGVGVAYKLACALLEKFEKLDFAKEILPLVALGTIGDVVPLLYENRLLVKKGIEAILEVHPKGILKLVEISGLDSENLSADGFAFGLVPRINAAGRLETAHCAIELLISDNDEVIALNAEKLQSLNVLRQTYCHDTYEQALALLSKEDMKKNKAIILYDENWNAGIIGIVASKLCETFNRPVFLITSDEQYLRCSSRGVNGLNLYDVLYEIRDELEVFGGHAKAAGFSAAKEKLEIISKKIHEFVNENLSDEDLIPSVEIECELEAGDVDIEFARTVDKLAPFGEKNPQPVFCIKDFEVVQQRAIGNNKNHLKLTLKKDDKIFEALCWNTSDLGLKEEDRVDAAFLTKLNFFNNNYSVQLEIQDIKSENLNSSASNNVKYIDHRMKPGIEKIFFNYLKTTKTTISIFAENKATCEYLSSQNLCNANVINRLDVAPVSQLVFFDIPPTREVVDELVEKSHAKVVHCLRKNSLGLVPVEVLKTLSGMLKYADSKLDGMIDVSLLASKLCISSQAFEAAVRLFQSSEIIEILDEDMPSMKIRFIQPKDINSLRACDEYEEFSKAVEEINDFRNNFELV